MELTLYDIIKGPRAYDQSLNKLVLTIHPKANKSLVKNALEKLFNVKVEKVNTLNRRGKTRRVKRITIHRPSKKIAIVTLKEGYSLDLFEQAGAAQTAPESSKTVEAPNKKA